jgi:hypothetical protein
MSAKESKDFPETAAKIISLIFNPLLMPVYGLLLIFSAPTIYGYLPFDVKKLLLLIVLINNVLLPVSLLPFFRYRNIISSWTIEKRIERNIPLIITTFFYLITSFIIYRLPVPVFLKSYLIAVFVLSLAVTVVNFWWKISIHSVGSGALTALVCILSLRMYSPLVWYLIVVIIVSGIILSSRLKLNLHNPLQIWLSFLAGFLGLYLSMQVF